MKKRIPIGFFILILFTLFFTVSPVSAVQREVINVAAASSFSYALKEIEKGFEAEGNVELRIIFGSSGVLTRQIQGGAPFDVFISANIGYMDTLQRSKALRPDSMRRFARGALVLAVRTEAESAGQKVTGLNGLLDKNIRKVAIANPEHAPYGKAAVEALKKAGLLRKIRKKLVYGENVRQALQFVDSGNASAGFIALSIAPVDKGAGGIRVLSIDDSLYSPIEQTVAVVNTTGHGEAAQKFIDYLTGPAGLEILQKYGFSAP